MESDITRNADLEQRLRIAGYREVLDFVMREGGARTLRSLWTTKVLWEDVSVRLDQARDVALMVQFSHRFAKFGQPTPRQKRGADDGAPFCFEDDGPKRRDAQDEVEGVSCHSWASYLMLFHHKNLKPNSYQAKIL